MLSPAKFAVIECAPAASADVVNVAFPVPSSGPVPSVVPVQVPADAVPSQKVTEPLLGTSKFELSVPVKTTDWLKVELVPVEAPTEALHVAHCSWNCRLQLPRLPESIGFKGGAFTSTYSFHVPFGSRPLNCDAKVKVPSFAASG